MSQVQTVLFEEKNRAQHPVTVCLGRSGAAR